MRSPSILVLLSAGLVSACASGGGGPSDPPGGSPVVSAVAGDSEVVLTWPDVGSATTYTVYWSIIPGGAATGTPISGASSPHTHAGLSNGQTYYYCVAAGNGAGEGPISAESSALPGSPYDPPWAGASPSQIVTHNHAPGLTPLQNGAELKATIDNLSPGQKLEIAGGTYSIQARFDISVVGSAAAPIWITAKLGEKVVITRPNASENTINIGSNGPARYIAIQGVEITGGDTAVKIYNTQNLWIDNCHIHHCDGAGIAANSANTDRLYLTRNHIHDPGGTAEGMYLGANNGTWVMSNSVIAKNHIHDTAGSQGDGIEVKQGSYGNWIVENLVYDTQYPCILLYGTGGNPVNLVERNICYGSGDNVMQIQGEALVRNNLIMAGAVGVHSHDHQGLTRDLTFVHNTIITSGRATNLSSWNARAGMTFANNVVYSRTAESIYFPGGSTGVTIAGNVVVGGVTGTASGYVVGHGLSDFVDVAWDGSRRNAVPAPGQSIISTGQPMWAVTEDLTGATRVLPLDSGAYDG